MIRNRNINVSIKNEKNKRVDEPAISKDQLGCTPDVRDIALPLIHVIEVQHASTTLRKKRMLNFKSVLL